MELGFVTAILPELSLAENLRFAAAEGFDCIEVMCWPKGKAERRYAGVTHIDVGDFSPGDAAEVARLVDETGVRISGLGYYPNPLTPDEDARSMHFAHIRKLIAVSAELGIGVANSFIGRDQHRNLEENLALFGELWPPVIEYADSLGVKVGIENCPMIFTNDEWPGGQNLAISPAVWDRMFEIIPSSNFGLNFDPSHFVWQQMDYLAAIRNYADRFVHVHAKDARLDREHLNRVGIMATPLEYHTPKLPGLGEVDWGKFYSELGDAGYDGPVCIEVEDRIYESSLERRKQAVSQSGRYLRQFM